MENTLLFNHSQAADITYFSFNNKIYPYLVYIFY